MTIKLKRVVLSNIRSHEYIVFNPSEEGMTAISGPNGTGKSTIVDSTAWVLFGTKPSGVSKASAIFRDNAKFGEDKCYAIVELEVDGKDVRVERRMVSKTGGTECEVWEYNSKTEEYDIQVAGPSVSHAGKYLRKFLKMDEKGFLAAILVQQKQVDQLISASPRERAEVIEKLTGISSVTAALVSARQEYNSLKKVASVSTADEETVLKLKNEEKSLREEAKKKVEIIKNLNTKIEESQENGIKVRESLEKAQKVYDLHESSRSKLTINNTRIESYEEELARVIEEKNDKKEKLSRISTGTSIEEIEPQLKGLKREQTETSVAIEQNKQSVKTFKKVLSAHTSLIEESGFKNVKEAQSEKKKATADLSENKKSLKNVLSEIASSTGEIKKVEKAISVISKGNGHCPTCLQEVSDVDIAVESLKKVIENSEKLINENKIKEDTLNNEQVILIDRIDFIDNVIKSFNEIDGVSQEINSATSELPGLEEKLQSIAAQIKSLDKIYSQIKYQADTKKEYSSLLSRAKTISDNIENLKKENQELEANVKGVKKVSSDALAKLRIKLDDARATHSELKTKKVKESGEFKVLKERLAHYAENIKREENNIKKYKDLLKSVEVAASAVNVIEEFRTERIKNSVPVIEVYASELFSRFTEGKFTRLKMDQKFNTTAILSNGSERPVGLLSGGELSAASMALRLAVSMLLNGGQSQSLMILDEVLVSQDDSRAEIILTTIKEVCKGQVIIIAHNENIDDIADLVVQL